MLLLSVNSTTIFAKLSDVYGECFTLIKDSPKLSPLQCFVDSCHVGRGCFDKLARRTAYILEQFPKARLLILYFKYHDRPNSLRGGLFWKDFEEAPRVITMNPYSWTYLKKIGEVFDLQLPESLFGGIKSNQVIGSENLIRTKE